MIYFFSIIKIERINMLTVFIKVLVIFAMILVGFVIAKRGMIPYSVNKYLVALLLEVTMPCMILSTMATSELSDEMKTETIQMLAISAIWFFVIATFVFVISKLMTKTPKEDIGVMMAVMTAVNTGFMGFPVTKSIFGGSMFFMIVIQNIALNIYLYTLAVFQINHNHSGAKGILGMAKSAISLCTISSVLGIVILFTGFKTPEPVVDFLTMLGDATVPLSMIIVGIQLSESKISEIIGNRDLVFASIVNVLIVPVFTFFIVNLLPVSTLIKAATVFAASFPCAVAVVGVTAKEKRNATLAAHGVTLSTALSLITLPLIATFLTSFYGL